MGQLTRGTIISEALLLAGDSSLTTRARVWLNAWTRSVYRSWPWPFLNRRASDLVLAAGATSLLVGVGVGGVTPAIQRLIDPIYVYDSAKSKKGRARIVNLTGGPVEYDESALNTTNTTGMPTMFKVRADPTNSAVWGKWSLVPYPIPDQSYLLAFDYLAQPNDMTSDSDTPLYPNDRTLIQAVLTDALSYMKGPGSDEHKSNLDILASMVVDDRMKYGEAPGINDNWGLDSNIFR